MGKGKVEESQETTRKNVLEPPGMTRIRRAGCQKGSGGAACSGEIEWLESMCARFFQ